MKRAKNLFEKITDIQNIKEGFLKALKRKRNSPNVILFCQNVDENLLKIQMRLKSLEPNFGSYRQFKIFDPKERVITAASFEERIIHHSIMNVLEPVFERQFVFHTYACRKCKGTHKAIKYAQILCGRYKCFLKLDDVKKYFENINHDVLKKMLLKIIKDKKCLALLFDLIDSFDPGLPIGNLTSQFFANFYLSCLDHFILESLKLPLIRYMDDFVVFSDGIENLKHSFIQIQKFCKNELCIELKAPNYGLCYEGLPFLGCRIRKNSCVPLRKNRLRRTKKMWSLKPFVDLGFLSDIQAESRCFV